MMAEKRVENELICAIESIVEKINSQVQSVRMTQVALRKRIDQVACELKRVGEEQPISVDLEPHIRRLINAKRRIVLTSNIVQNVLERLTRLDHSIETRTLRSQAVVEAQRALIDLSQAP